MYLLFISYNSGLMHNHYYHSLNDLYTSVEQLVLEEELTDKLISKKELSEGLKKEDDYRFSLTNNTWFHIQNTSFYK
ncbi:MAG: hypothetical protein IT215_09335 [Chitinophagaceae bacterium]|nr:hypothetical protein [Chitinophagaceae bacterium]HMN32435.1 hypothetical protein [Chitinophagaceae bacterium]